MDMATGKLVPGGVKAETTQAGSLTECQMANGIIYDFSFKFQLYKLKLVTRKEQINIDKS